MLNHLSVLIYSNIHHEVFIAGALEARVRRTSAFRSPAGSINQFKYLIKRAIWQTRVNTDNFKFIV